MEILYIGKHTEVCGIGELKPGEIPLDGSWYEYACVRVMLPDPYLKFQCNFRMYIDDDVIRLHKQKDLDMRIVSEQFRITASDIGIIEYICYNTIFFIKKMGESKDINYLIFCMLTEDEALNLRQFASGNDESELYLFH